MACPITVSKFVGTVSLGLLTGLSFATSSITIPSLQSLPNASTASRTLKELQLRTRKNVLRLSNITAIALFTAFSLSSPRRKHPYLIWTALMSLIGGTGLECWYNRKSMTWSCLSASSLGFGSCSRSGFGVISWGSARAGAGGSVSVRADDEDSNGNGSEIEIVGDEEASSAAAAAAAAANAEQELNVNGEAVQREMEQEGKFQRFRALVLGLGFSMAVVGIWGDGA
ncbi:hypothetical protein AJ79_05804 [Helicocarpus griseus UAMH5409]|uniref:Uncharacterized protein n=1 Tax=Helicocarpus griseus UAMH5409 TaxID=1447875 RepID=A0A2B7XJC6_9EURO|nr:hypothetical protein AJ79_05804 [Helicocarpus griseus UAMH5409]